MVSQCVAQCKQSNSARHLSKRGYSNLITKSRSELDLTSQAQASSFFDKHRPDYVLLAATKVGGILANK